MYQKEYWEHSRLNKRRSVTHPVIEAYVLSKIHILRDCITLDPSMSLLDVGCGNGFFTYYFNSFCHTTGVDYSFKMLELNPVKQKCMMDANILGFKDNTFDIVFCHAMLHHVLNISSVLDEMARVSKKYVIILEPNRNNPLMFLFSLIVKEERKALKFSLDYLKKEVEHAGLRVMDAFSLGMIVPNKTPAFLLPVVNRLNFKQPFGMTNFIVAGKNHDVAPHGGVLL